MLNNVYFFSEVVEYLWWANNYDDEHYNFVNKIGLNCSDSDKLKPVSVMAKLTIVYSFSP